MSPAGNRRGEPESRQASARIPVSARRCPEDPRDAAVAPLCMRLHLFG